MRLHLKIGDKIFNFPIDSIVFSFRRDFDGTRVWFYDDALTLRPSEEWTCQEVEDAKYGRDLTNAQASIITQKMVKLNIDFAVALGELISEFPDQHISLSRSTDFLDCYMAERGWIKVPER